MIGIKIEVHIQKPGSHLKLVKPDTKKAPTEPEDSAGEIVTPEKGYLPADGYKDQY